MWPTLFKIPWIDLPIRGYGLMLMIGFLGGTWWAAKRAARVKCDPDFVVNLGFVALITSVIGARAFYVIHYWDDHFAGRGIWPIINVSAGGLEFYGGLLGAMAGTLSYMLITGKSVRLYFDIITPSVMFGMGMARIGCFLNGCCWGGQCPPDMAWSVRFPYASPTFHSQWQDRQVTVPAELIFVNGIGRASPIHRDLLTLTPEERDGARVAYRNAVEELKEAEAAGASAETLVELRKRRDELKEKRDKAVAQLAPLIKQAKLFNLTYSELEQLANRSENRTAHVHPAQLYASLDGFLLAILLHHFFHRRKRHGMVFGLFLLLYPPTRIIEEIIRTDNPHDTAYLTISQFVSVLLIAAGIAWILAIRRKPLRSPRAVPWVPPELEPATGNKAR